MNFAINSLSNFIVENFPPKSAASLAKNQENQSVFAAFIFVNFSGKINQNGKIYHNSNKKISVFFKKWGNLEISLQNSFRCSSFAQNSGRKLGFQIKI